MRNKLMQLKMHLDTLMQIHHPQKKVYPEDAIKTIYDTRYYVHEMNKIMERLIREKKD